MTETMGITRLSVGFVWVRELLDLLEILWQHGRAKTDLKPRPRRQSKRRSLKARSPEHCADCQAEGWPTVRSPSAKRVVVPWSARKSKPGRPKEIETEGYACANVKCEYEGVTEAALHALVGGGHHGTQELIQDLRCQACRVKFSIWRDTALSQLKTPSQRVGQASSALAEGLDPAAASRVFGHSESTIGRWLNRAGARSFLSATFFSAPEIR